MTIATLKDFEITNIEEDYYTGSEFNVHGRTIRVNYMMSPSPCITTTNAMN